MDNWHVWADPLFATACLAVGGPMLHWWFAERRKARKERARRIAEIHQNSTPLNEKAIKVMGASRGISPKPNRFS